MSEKFGRCKVCKGSGQIPRRDPVLWHMTKVDCLGCDGTGFDGSADTYGQNLQEEEENSNFYNGLI